MVKLIIFKPVPPDAAVTYYSVVVVLDLIIKSTEFES
jgi:hypothetical protein